MESISVRVTRDKVQDFLSVKTLCCCYCYGYGCGYGNGYGDGYGYRYGDGSGEEEGDGYGNGYGYEESDGIYRCSYGSGSKAGYGFGHGSGYGSGNDYGDGYGYGYNKFYANDDNKDIKVFNDNIVDYIDNIPIIITQVHYNIAYGYIINIDLTLKPCFIAKVGNSFAHGNTIKKAVSDANSKEMLRAPVEERIDKFKETFGSLDSRHKGKEFYDWHHTLTGSCRMGRDEFCKAHDIDLEKKYTVRYFLDITKNSYGRDVIKLLRKAYKILK